MVFAALTASVRHGLWREPLHPGASLTNETVGSFMVSYRPLPSRGKFPIDKANVGLSVLTSLSSSAIACTYCCTIPHWQNRFVFFEFAQTIHILWLRFSFTPLSLSLPLRVLCLSVPFNRNAGSSPAPPWSLDCPYFALLIFRLIAMRHGTLVHQ